MTPRTIDPANPPVAVGQTRIDTHGGRLYVDRLARGERYVVTYPALDFESATLGADTIRQLYPIVTETRNG